MFRTISTFYTSRRLWVAARLRVDASRKGCALSVLVPLSLVAHGPVWLHLSPGVVVFFWSLASAIAAGPGDSLADGCSHCAIRTRPVLNCQLRKATAHDTARFRCVWGAEQNADKGAMKNHSTNCVTHIDDPYLSTPMKFCFVFRNALSVSTFVFSAAQTLAPPGDTQCTTTETRFTRPWPSSPRKETTCVSCPISSTRTTER